jgi:hypothetical protein
MNTENDNTSQSKLPSGAAIAVMIEKFQLFIEAGIETRDEIVTIDNVKCIILCHWHINEHINGMRCYAVHDGKHPELAMTLSMIEWET